LEYLCNNLPGFENTRAPDEVYFNQEGSGHKFPDLQTYYRGRKYVFELQLSQTYLPVVADRESFYRRDGTVLLWLSNQFELRKDRQTERDILAVRSLQIFEISEESILQSLKDKELYFDVHYRERNFALSPEVWEWKKRRVRFSELAFDEYLIESRAFDPWTRESELLRAINSEKVKRFDDYWKNNRIWDKKLSDRLHAQFRRGVPYDASQTGEALKKRALEVMWEIVQFHGSAENALDNLGLALVLDTLFAIRDGKNYRNNQDVVGLFATTLEKRSHFTDALIAAAYVYGQTKILNNPKILTKARRNIEGEGEKISIPQCHEFDRFFALILPRAASHLRVSALPYLQSLKRSEMRN
jgi:hypothetical protein